MGQMISSRTVWFVADENGTQKSGYFDDPDSAVAEDLRQLAKHDFFLKFSAIVAKNCMKFDYPVHEGHFDFKEVIDGFYITKCDEDWCGESLLLKDSDWKSGHEERYGKMIKTPLSDCSRQSMDLIGFGIDISGEDDDGHSKRDGHYHVWIEESKITDKFDTADKIRDLIKRHTK